MNNPYLINTNDITPEMVDVLLEGKVVNEGDEIPYQHGQRRYHAGTPPYMRQIKGKRDKKYPSHITPITDPEEKRGNRRVMKSVNVQQRDSGGSKSPYAPNDLVNSGTTPEERLKIKRKQQELSDSQARFYKDNPHATKD
jgi:hypothetical protein